MRCIMPPGQTTEKSDFTAVDFNTVNDTLQLTVPAEARGIRALVLTWWYVTSKSQALFSLYSLESDGTLTRIDGFGGNNSYMLEPTYNVGTYKLTAEASSAWSCCAMLLY